MKNIVEDARHQHPLVHRMQTCYADVGQSVQRDLNVPPNFLYGKSTQKVARDDVQGFLNGVFIDKGYSIRKLEIPRDKMKETSKMYHVDPIAKDKYESAGVKT